MYDNNDEIANAEDEDIKPDHMGAIWQFFRDSSTLIHFWKFQMFFLSEECP